MRRRIFVASCMVWAALAHAAPEEADVQTWLKKSNEANRRNSYTGTFVVSSGRKMFTASIVHAYDGTVQAERIEALTGRPRITYRHAQEVLTVFPLQRTALLESRETAHELPFDLPGGNGQVGQWYRLLTKGQDRMAGLEANEVQIQPKDAWRYGYAIWSDKQTGLVLKMQTLDADGKVLEQVAFSEVQLGVTLSPHALLEQMLPPDGYRVVRREKIKVKPESIGWKWSAQVPGFQPVAAYARENGTSGQEGMQWIFSDGLSTASVFAEHFDPARHQQEGGGNAGGATHVWGRKLGDWWLTAIGEVPLATLKQLVQGLERLP